MVVVLKLFIASVFVTCSAICLAGDFYDFVRDARKGTSYLINEYKNKKEKKELKKDGENKIESLESSEQVETNREDPDFSKQVEINEEHPKSSEQIDESRKKPDDKISELEKV